MTIFEEVEFFTAAILKMAIFTMKPKSESALTVGIGFSIKNRSRIDYSKLVTNFYPGHYRGNRTIYSVSDLTVLLLLLLQMFCGQSQK